MDSKERMLCALRRGKPDRMPVTVHQWQGYHLDKYLNGMSDLEAFQKFGVDAQIQYFADMGQFWLVDADYTKASTREWQVHELFEKVGYEGGYICSISDHFFETLPEKLQIFADAARECTY